MTFNDRKHFFAAAGLAMRRILVERARRVAGPEAGGDRVRVDLDVRLGEAEPQEEPDWAALDEAMTALTAEDPELAEVVHLRYYAGLNVNEVAEALETSPRTVDRRWQVARAWLLEFLTQKGGDPRF
jgi:RNA polymerase sigma factor (TIGR02999 family)